MITVASGISTLLIAIGTFLITRIVDKNVFYGISIAIFAGGIVLTVIGIWFFVKSYSVRKYKYPMGHEHFFDEKGVYKKKLVAEVRNLPKKEFNDRLYTGYLDSIKTSAELNQQKANGIKSGQKFLTFIILNVGFLVAFILILMGIGLIKLA